MSMSTILLTSGCSAMFIRAYVTRLFTCTTLSAIVRTVFVCPPLSPRKRGEMSNRTSLMYFPPLAGGLRGVKSKLSEVLCLRLLIIENLPFFHDLQIFFSWHIGVYFLVCSSWQRPLSVGSKGGFALLKSCFEDRT